MGNLHVRIDDRLIHGQIVASWARSLNIRSIIAVDNEMAHNAMIKDILLMGVPKEFDPQIISEDMLEEALQENLKSKNVLLITRFAKNLKNLSAQVMLATEVNIGNCSKQADSVYISKGIGVGQVLSFSQEDIDVLDSLQENGIKIITQQMPSDKEINWSTLKKNLKKL
ncbi:MAG: PTS sugar transporter subunit IIB [Erysipelothrix sp.]|nr:PTS sugar transporter subunit IIB [Erysipelothrix sp.]